MKWKLVQTIYVLWKSICDFSVLHDCYVGIYWKQNDVENLAVSLVSTFFHTNIYSKISSSYRGNLAYVFAGLRFLSLIIMNVQN